jgi:hypothetical protein
MSLFKVLIVGLYHIYSKFIILINSCSTIIQGFEWWCSLQTMFLVRKLQNVVIAGLIYVMYGEFVISMQAVLC